MTIRGLVAALATFGLLGVMPSARAATTITTQTPSSGPVGSMIHVEGRGCPAAPGQAAGTYRVDNGSGVDFQFNSDSSGAFSFDYPVPPAEAGDQTTNSVYSTYLHCNASGADVAGAKFSITGPVFSLPTAARVGELVKVTGHGCVHDDSADADGILLVNGTQVATIKARDDYTFDVAFRVPELLRNRRFVVQVNCLIQRLESAAGDGGQRSVVPALLLIEPDLSPVTSAATTPTPTSHHSGGVPLAPLVVAALLLLALAGVAVGRRRRHAPVEDAVFAKRREEALEPVGDWMTDVEGIAEPEPLEQADADDSELRAQEQLEHERVEAEQREAERAAAEQREADRVERRDAEQREKKRVKAERREAKRLEAERIEAERIEAERIEHERAEAERIEAERIEHERAEAERIEAERIEAERIEAEEAQLEAERREQERLEAERLKREIEALIFAEREVEFAEPEFEEREFEDSDEPEPESEPETEAEAEPEPESEPEPPRRTVRAVPLRAERDTTPSDVDYHALALAALRRRELSDEERLRPRSSRPRQMPVRSPRPIDADEE